MQYLINKLIASYKHIKWSSGEVQNKYSETKNLQFKACLKCNLKKWGAAHLHFLMVTSHNKKKICFVCSMDILDGIMKHKGYFNLLLLHRAFKLFSSSHMWFFFCFPLLHFSLTMSLMHAVNKFFSPRPNIFPKIKYKNITSTCLLAISEHFQGLVQYFHRKVGRPDLIPCLQTQTCPVKDAEGCHTR